MCVWSPKTTPNRAVNPKSSLMDRVEFFAVNK